MKGLSTLTNSRNKYQTKGLVSIQNRSIKNFVSQNSRLQQVNRNLVCAYHHGQRITNFCKSRNCLLPLCPKCVKIHTQQHQKMGIFGNFQALQQCLQQCFQQQQQTLHNLSNILTQSQLFSLSHKTSLTNSLNQLQTSKQQLIQFINEVFTFYQTQVQLQLIEQSKVYQYQLITFHKEIVSLLESQKSLLRKYQNKNLKLQFLIDFYSKQNSNQLVNNYQHRIQQIKPYYINLTVNTYQLQRLKVIIKKYLDFGQNQQKITKNIQSNIKYQKITLYESQTLNNDFGRQQNFRSPIKNLYKQDISSYGFTQRGEVSKIIQQRLNRESKLDTFQSPLQAYSLEKSRKLRS